MRYRQLLLVLFSFAFAVAAFAAEKLSTEELIQNLKAQDPKVRADAGKELGDRGEKLGLEALDQATLDKDPKVQLAVVEALGKIPNPQQVAYLSRAVRNTSGEAQEKGIHLLTEYYVPREEHNKLAQLWNSFNALFESPDVRTVEPWIQVDDEAIDAITFVMDQKESENRMEAAAALGVLRAKQSIPRIAYYLRSENTKMVRICVRSLGYIGDPEAGSYLIPMLKHRNDDIVIDSTRVLGQLRYHDALPELQRLFEYSGKDSQRRAALQAISRIADPAYEALMLKYMKSDDKALRQYATEAIGRMKLQNHVQTLQLAFQREKSMRIKLALCFSLYSLGQTAYIDTIVLKLKDSDYSDQAEGYLVELGATAVPSIASYLKSSDMKFRVRLIEVLGNMHQPAAIPYVEPYLKDKNLDVAQAATDTVGKLRRLEKAQSM
jgi:HEAT repeat protein